MPGKQPSIYSSSYTTKQNCVSGNRKQLYTCFILASDQPLAEDGDDGRGRRAHALSSSQIRTLQGRIIQTNYRASLKAEGIVGIAADLLSAV